MTFQDFEVLKTKEIRRLIEENIDRDPAETALRLDTPHVALIATQIKYLQRARKKAPYFYAARCIIPPVAYEQSTSQALALRMEWRGDVCVDLTCGLGVDAFHLSQKFRRLIAVERDPVIAAVTEYNFALLGATNIEVINTTAEEYLDRLLRGGDGLPALPVDLIYVDPDRRGAGNIKKVLLETLSPNVLEMLPRLREAAERIVVKCSPMFDVNEGFRLLGPACRVHVVSEEGECKQLAIEIGPDIKSRLIRAAVIGRGFFECDMDDIYLPNPVETGDGGGLDEGKMLYIPGRGLVAMPDPSEFRWLLIPDVALQKARLVAVYFDEEGIFVPGENSFVFALDSSREHFLTRSAAGEKLMGRYYGIEWLQTYRPKELKKYLKDQGIKRITVLKREFPLSVQEITRQLDVTEGGSVTMAFTTLNGKWTAAMLRPPLVP